MLVASAAAIGAPAGGAPRLPASKLKAYVPESLLSAVQQNPRGSFDVIVQGSRHGQSSDTFLEHAFRQANEQQGQNGDVDENQQFDRIFQSITGGQLTLTGRQILALASTSSVTSILANEAVTPSALTDLPLANVQKHLWVAGAPVNWTSTSLAAAAPTIAVVDSGIDPATFGSRLLGQVSLATLAPNGPGDTYGHGTFVAGVAAGAAAGHAGVAPTANVLSLDIMSDAGASTVGDVVTACDWILANKSAYNIKVANFSLHGGNQASIFYDPIDQCVERLWLNGVVVVAAAGNYAVNGAQSNVPFAPANDPFVITVGASDILNTMPVTDDVAAPWSAWGYTHDGFSKPDLSAPGRYVVAAMPPAATLAVQRPDHVVAGGYMQLSGTSFSAPAVAGAAAVLIAQHPEWTPDQVKGALMYSAKAAPAATRTSLGVGVLDVAGARSVVSPPNPNIALSTYVSTNPVTGAKVFDAAAWQSAALANAAWGSAAWSSAAWGSAAWSSAAWGSAAWGSAAWSSASWSSAAWGSAAWGSAAWSSAAWASAAWSDAAWADTAPFSIAISASLDSPITDAETDAVLIALGLKLPPPPPPPVVPPPPLP
jgi:serine protease AprX